MKSDYRVGNGFIEERKSELVVEDFCRGKIGIEISRKRKSMCTYDSSRAQFQEFSVAERRV